MRWGAIGDEQNEFIGVPIGQFRQKQIHTIGTHRRQNNEITYPVKWADRSISIGIFPNDLLID